MQMFLIEFAQNQQAIRNFRGNDPNNNFLVIASFTLTQTVLYTKFIAEHFILFREFAYGNDFVFLSPASSYARVHELFIPTQAACLQRGRDISQVERKGEPWSRTFPTKMPAYTIPAGSNYTITQFVRSRAIKSLTFMVGNGKIKRLTLFPGVLIFNRPIFFILSSYFTQTERPYPQCDNDYYTIYYIQDQSRD